MVRLVAPRVRDCEEIPSHGGLLMKLGLGAILRACVCALLLSYPLVAAEDAPRWQTGHLKSADLGGHGPITGKRSDIWWVYCISTDKSDYSVVSRASPAKAGLTVGDSVRFSVENGLMTISNSKGEQREFRIMRQGKGNICR